MAHKGMETLKDLTRDELVAQEAELREAMFQMRFKNQMRQLDNPLKIRGLRRQIARVQTLIGQPVRPAKPAPPAKPARAAKTAKTAGKEKTR